MKIKTLPLVAALVAGLLVWLAVRTEAQHAPNTREVMKLKLNYAQNVLEGITTENTDLIVANAEKLSALSKAAGWRARERTLQRRVPPPQRGRGARCDG